ncbi:MAG: hypothetical protein ACYC67_10150 [Prosthecobacter sp.]
MASPVFVTLQSTWGHCGEFIFRSECGPAPITNVPQSNRERSPVMQFKMQSELWLPFILANCVMGRESLKK